MKIVKGTWAQNYQCAECGSDWPTGDTGFRFELGKISFQLDEDCAKKLYDEIDSLLDKDE